MNEGDFFFFLLFFFANTLFGHKDYDSENNNKKKQFSIVFMYMCLPVIPVPVQERLMTFDENVWSNDL